MVDWLKVFKLAPRAVVLLVNEQREQPNIGEPVVRAELRFDGRVMVYKTRFTGEDLDAAFSAMNETHAVEWVINMARDFREQGVHQHA
jgi:hypothetical protein